MHACITQHSGEFARSGERSKTYARYLNCLRCMTFTYRNQAFLSPSVNLRVLHA